MSLIQTIKLEGLDEARNLFGEERFKKASGRAVKKALDRSATKLSREIRQEWNIKKMMLDPLIHKKMDYSGEHPTGYLTARSRSLSWRFFGAKQVEAGVRVKIKRKGSAKTYVDAFWAINLRGTTGKQAAGYGFVLKRSKKHRRKYAVRDDAVNIDFDKARPRLKLKLRRVMTIATMFEKTQTYEPVKKFAGEVWQNEFLRQLTL